ncbi:type III restriction enzyme [Fibrobacter sp. UWB13]|nr:type III restriction enzyme [Fibrobacter sp. UWB13]
MEFQFEQNLPHQREAIERILALTGTLHAEHSLNHFANCDIYPNDSKLQAELSKIQKDFQPNMKGFTTAQKAAGVASMPCLYIDVKMETGTGKTYVYTETIHELHKQLGVSKFILIVPGKAIKAGAKNFIEDPDVRRHFRDTCGYGAEIRLFEGSEQKGNKKKKLFPSAVSGFYQNPGESERYISVLLLNSALLTNSNYKNDDFDYGIDNFYCPLEALKATRPIVIIDEPHRFSDGNKAMDAIMNLCPQMLIRFGATFPEMTVGRGKEKRIVKDYKNLVYNLDAYESFNKNLIKGIAKEHLNPLKDAENIKVKVAEITKIDKDNCETRFSWEDALGKSHRKTLALGIPLSEIHENFGNLIIEDFDKNEIHLSNGVVLKVGDTLTPDMYATTYQEAMMRMAIRRHLETEEQNFNREDKIKTLALFFIDDISAYRHDNGALRRSFEKILKAEINKKIEGLKETDPYCGYLQKSLTDISATHGGYFAQDNSSSEESVAQEISEILHDKKKLLSMDNLRRFIFSKWTLKEGWDNPNVFTIAKLRSSGSEISKLQEVGRGLRLPVNEFGKRITDEEFTLNYIVDYTEKEFADKLIAEINGEREELMFITDEQIEEFAQKNGIEAEDLLSELLGKKFVKMRKGDMPGLPVNPEKVNEFASEYPDLFKVCDTSRKIIDRNKKNGCDKIKIRSGRYNQLKNLWLKMNEHYLLTFDDKLNDELENALPALIKQDLFAITVAQSIRQKVTTQNGVAKLHDSSGNSYEVERKIGYGKFLQRIQQKESVPVVAMHQAICKFVQDGGEPMFNEQSLKNICAEIHRWKLEKLMGRFSYQKVERTRIKKTTLNKADGSSEEFITLGLVGKFMDVGEVPEKYLYDSIAYDSPLEKDDILNDVEGVEVYGKIPKSTVRIPTILGETYSPDFMYIVRRKDKNELNLIVECKDVENAETDLRGGEKIKIESAKVFFENLESEGVKVCFKKQLKQENLKAIVEDL